jgi:uncharacterized protein
VTLTCLPPFPEGRWYDPAAVRRYRAALAALELEGFGFTFGGGGRRHATAALIAGALPRLRFTAAPAVAVDVVTFAPYGKGPAPATAVQICTLTNQGQEELALPFSWGGELALTRASYAQLTEGGPLPRPADDYSLAASEEGLLLENRGLGWTVAILGLPPGAVHHEKRTGQVVLRLNGALRLEPGVPLRLIVRFGLGETPAAARQEAEQAAQTGSQRLLEETVERWQDIGEWVETTHAADTAWHARRAVTYVLSCCAAPVSPAGTETTCLITDHQLLPLGWTRDAYYQAQALIRVRRHAASRNDALAAEVDSLLRRHLLWLFQVAERPEGYWGRAYLTNGRCKDHVFQLDQQCYPLLELADYYELTGDEALLRSLQGELFSLLTMLLERRAPEAWLFPTSETPADTRSGYPITSPVRSLPGAPFAPWPAFRAFWAWPAWIWKSEPRRYGRPFTATWWRRTGAGRSLPISST